MYDSPTERTYDPQGFEYADEEGLRIKDNAAIRAKQVTDEIAASGGRTTLDDSVGTPAHLEEHSPENMHSDGGNTLFEADLTDQGSTSAEPLEAAPADPPAAEQPPVQESAPEEPPTPAQEPWSDEAPPQG